tara:strand:+ start:12448 stop:13428 length:981 start_codon:yes stop_codon:yes gene_type:complete
MHTYYYESLFNQFPKQYKIIYGHSCDHNIGKNYFFLKERLLKYLFNVDYFVCNNICDYFSSNSIKIYIHHNIYDDPWVSSEKEEIMCKRLLNYNYILVSYENSQKRVIEMFRKYKLNNIPKILDTGYFKLDYFMKDSKKNFYDKKDSILIAPTGIDGFPELSIIKKLENIINELISQTNFKIILRPHPRDRANPQILKTKNIFSNEDRFIFDISENYIETFSRSKLMVTDMSGTAYTYAYINLSPVIFFSMSENYLSKNGYKNHDFYVNREKIGKVILNESELIKSINFLIENSDNYNKKILQLRKNMKYFMKSKERVIEIFDGFN